MGRRRLPSLASRPAQRRGLADYIVADGGRPHALARKIFSVPPAPPKIPTTVHARTDAFAVPRIAAPRGAAFLRFCGRWSCRGATPVNSSQEVGSGYRPIADGNCYGRTCSAVCVMFTRAFHRIRSRGIAFAILNLERYSNPALGGRTMWVSEQS